ncbi:Ankyrin Repeat [Seminavis robusta]|uniref:Ankyrin Repeat n=1 Tax=Seminavis robusta TaxID=568900 RepID=A0A9N8HAJ0_9STRA|nr:Ankyrin Repeat [Seminavis robusta]|eukprot:Sro298_g111130.1 Ankyrin Repeat (1056) ;mRNA; f:44044-47446
MKKNIRDRHRILRYGEPSDPAAKKADEIIVRNLEARKWTPSILKETNDLIRNNPTCLGTTPLAKATGWGQKSSSRYGENLLHLALKFDAPEEIIETILKKYEKLATMTAETSRNWTPLHMGMAGAARPESIRMVLAAFPRAAEMEDSNGRLPLHLGMFHRAPTGAIAVVLDANPKAASKSDIFWGTPLHSGLTSYHPAKPQKAGDRDISPWSLKSITMVLDAFPAAVGVLHEPSLTLEGETPLHLAMRPEFPLETILSMAQHCPSALGTKNRAGRTPVLAGLEHGIEAEVLQSILVYFPEVVEGRLENGRTMLHQMMGKPIYDEVVAMVVQAFETHEKGYSVCKDMNGHTPLHLAMSTNASHPAVSDLLENSPYTTKDLLDREGRSPLYLGVQNGASIQTLKLVLDAFPEAMVLCKQRTPLHICAARDDAPDIIAAVVNAYPGAATTLDRDGMSPLHRYVQQPSVPAVMALLTSYPDAAKVKDKNGYTPLHTIAKRVSMSSLAASVAMARAVVNHCPAAARAKDRQGNTALLFLAMELMSKADQQRSRPQPQNTSGSHLFRALCHAYPLAAEIENDSGVSPISFLINLQVRALSAGRTPANEVTTRVPPIKSLLKGLRDGRPLKKLCNLERPSFLTMYLMLFFNDNSHDSSRNTKTIDINEKVIPGWTFLEILADLDNDDASDMLIQIVEQRGHWCSGDQNVKIVCSDDAKTILQFQTRNKATEETMRKVADRAKLSLSSERLRNWGQTYGRFLGRYRINKDQEPKHISETCVVAFAMESRVDGSGQRYEAQVALKFLSSFDAFCREIDKRRIIDLHYEAHAERHFVVPIVAAYTSIAENDASKAAQACMESVGVVYEANLLEGLQTHQNILTSGRGTDDIAYLLVMECGAGLDLHDVISHHNIAGRNLPMVLSIATCIAECLQYLNEKCQVVHGDVKARNFVSLGVGAGFAAIDLDNAASIEDCEAVGKKRTSSGYLPPEQARVEASLRGTKGAPLAHAMVHAELKGLKEEMIRAYDVGNYQEQLRLLEAHNEAKGKLEQIQNVAPPIDPLAGH